MRYMMLIYSKERDEGVVDPQEAQKVMEGHWAVMDETTRRGVFVAVDALERTSASTTVRLENGKVLVTDGPFAETKEELAGYYILDCKDLDEAIGWAAKIPTACCGGEGCIEIRPVQEIPRLRELAGKAGAAWPSTVNG